MTIKWELLIRAGDAMLTEKISDRVLLSTVPVFARLVRDSILTTLPWMNCGSSRNFAAIDAFS